MGAFPTIPGGVSRSTGAARYWTEKELGGPTRNVATTTTVQTTATTVVNNNPDRVGLVVINLGSVDVFAWIDNTVSTSKAVRLNANGGFFSLNVRDDFTLVAEQWVAIGNGGTAAVAAIEVINDVRLAPEGHP